MSFVKPFGLFVFVILSLSNVKGEDASSLSKSTANELISVTELNSIDKVYSAMLKSRIMQKIRDTCNGNSECKLKWTELEKQLLKEEPTQVAKSRESMAQILMARYSKEQLAWLAKTYNTPLLKDFRKFSNSAESAGPIGDMMEFLVAKIKQTDAVGVKPSIKK